MHLTNYSLNKRSSNYKHAVSDQQTDGSKRKLTLVWQQLAELYGMTKVERIQILIREMINKTILAITPELRVEYEFELPSSKKPNLSCFQVKRKQNFESIRLIKFFIDFRSLVLTLFSMNI